MVMLYHCDSQTPGLFWPVKNKVATSTHLNPSWNPGQLHELAWKCHNFIGPTYAEDSFFLTFYIFNKIWGPSPVTATHLRDAWFMQLVSYLSHQNLAFNWHEFSLQVVLCVCVYPLGNVHLNWSWGKRWGVGMGRVISSMPCVWVSLGVHVTEFSLIINHRYVHYLNSAFLLVCKPDNFPT